jgi:GntR family transcriptional regulator
MVRTPYLTGRRLYASHPPEATAQQGVPVEEIAYALLARAGAQTSERMPVLFVECNEPELEQYKAELEEQLPVMVEAVLLEELESRVREDEEPSWRLVVTTFYHIHEVEKLMEPRGTETFALLTETTLDGLRRLAEQPEGTPVRVVGNSRTCTDNLLRSLKGAGLDHLDLFQVQEDDEEGRSRIKQAKVVVCASAVARRLPELGIPEGVEVIVQDRTLSKGGVEMLGQLLRRLPPSIA